MEELTESARQCLVSQGIIIGALSLLDSIGLLLTGMAVTIRSADVLHFTSLSHLATLEIVCGLTSILVVAYLLWTVAAYRNRQLEIRSKYLDESMSRGLIAIILPLLLTFSAFVVSAIFMMLKAESTSTYDLKSAMSLYSTDVTRKLIIDRLQSGFECCGSQSLIDWFLIDWQNKDLEPQQHLHNNTFSDWDSVPFSCCCPEAPPPCIHHQLRIFGVGSLFTVGCADKLDEAVFIYILMTMILFFSSTFLMTFLIYTTRKLQTSARSAIIKGDATAPGYWWLISPVSLSDSTISDDRTPLLLEEKNSTGDFRRKNEGSLSLVGAWSKRGKVIANPCLVTQKSKIIDSTINEDWETYKTGSRMPEVGQGDSSEDWTRRAYDASGSTSTTSFLTTSLPVNSTPEFRRSVSDTAVANLEVSHHFEHKFRPLYRS